MDCRQLGMVGVVASLSLALSACGRQTALPASRPTQALATQAGGAGVALPTGGFVSFQVTTPGLTNRYLRHSGGLAWTELVTPTSPDLLKADATWKIVPALDGTPCYSFESKNSPGQYLRHTGFRLRKDPFENSATYRQDATYCAQTGSGSAGGLSFVSRNYPGYYIRHINAELYIAKLGAGHWWDSAASYHDDVSWNLAAPWDTSTGPGGGAGSINSVAPSSIPVPSGSGVLSLKVQNGTNGVYTDAQIYWGVLGLNPVSGRWSYLDLGGTLQPMSQALNDAPGHLSKNGVNYANIYHRVSDAQWASLPQVTAGRLYLCVGTPCYIKTFDDGFAGPDINNPSDPNLNVYFDFIEFTVDGGGYHGNTTRVDGFGFPLQHRLVNRAGTYDRTVGEPESESRAGLFNRFKAELPANFTHLAELQAPYRIVAPRYGEFRAGGPQGSYFDSYVNSVWPSANRPSTQNVFLCNGPVAEDAQGCAALNRHVYQNRNAWNDPAQYYPAAPANFYAQFWHRHALDALAYGFAYDDVNQQAAYLEVGDPKGLILRVGW